MFKFVISYCILVAAYCSARLTPSYITPCQVLTSDCLTNAYQKILPEFSKGIPELNVAPIDPLTNNYSVITLPGGFKVELSNSSMTGLRKCIFDSVSFNNNQIDTKMHCNLTIRGKYKAQGRILIVTINGDGDAKVKIKNAYMHAKVRFENKIRDGIVYYEIKDFDNTFSYGDKVTFGLTNLFKGNAELSEAVLQFFNENWKQIAEEFGKPLVEKLIEIVYAVIKVFFEKVPKEELFP